MAVRKNNSSIRQAMSVKSAALIHAAEIVERLARLEEQMHQVVAAVEKLTNRDSELEASLRDLSVRFGDALDRQAETFRTTLAELAEKFVSREDWVFWKSLLTAGLIGLTAYGWTALVGYRH